MLSSSSSLSSSFELFRLLRGLRDFFLNSIFGTDSSVSDIAKKKNTVNVLKNKYNSFMKKTTRIISEIIG